jgi:glycerol kinase
MSYVGSIDQGTSSSRFILFDKQGNKVAHHQIKLTQIYPKEGSVSN